jgi:hemolysin-activating ACP:hemolysin acyltransferase
MSKKKVAKKPAKKLGPQRVVRKPIPPQKLLAQQKTVAGKPSKVLAKPVEQIAARRDQWWKTFSQTIAVLMRDARFKDMKVSELESLVMPPVISGQYRLAHAKIQSPDNANGGVVIAPVAVALWARVSPAVDKLLMENLEKQVTFGTSDWVSGDIIWLTLVAGNKKFVDELMKNLAATEFKGRKVRVRSRGADGKTTVRLLGQTE